MLNVHSLEVKTVEKMIALYCSHHHDTAKKEMCNDCAALNIYSQERIAKCPFGDKKPVCGKCTIHCYQKDKRAEIKRVMRYAGPRMLYVSPLLTLRYIFRKVCKSKND